MIIFPTNILHLNKASLSISESPKMKVKPRGKLVLIYTRIVEISNSETQLEPLWITANQPEERKFIVGNIYRPPNENHKASLDTLKKTIQLQGLSHKPEVYILGDFNINMAAKKQHSNQGFELVATLSKYGSTCEIINKGC